MLLLFIAIVCFIYYLDPACTVAGDHLDLYKGKGRQRGCQRKKAFLFRVFILEGAIQSAPDQRESESALSVVAGV